MISKVNISAKISSFAFLIFFVGLFTSLKPCQAQYQGCQYIAQIPIEECQALERFYEQTNGRFWQNNRGWLVSNQPCNWFGVTCTSSSWPRNVVSIKFSVNDVSGSLPGELSDLSELRELVIENSQAGADGEFTQLGGEIPAVLNGLKKLEVLWLSHNKIGQSLANDLGSMESLRVLRLDNNLLTGPVPSELANLSQLEEIDLSNNNLAGAIPPEFAQLGRLHTLILAKNMMRGEIPPALGNMGSLRKLDLSSNEFTGSIPASITSLNRLNSLRLDGNDLAGVVNYFQATHLSALPECEIVGENETGLCLPEYDLPTGPICGMQADSNCGFCAQVDEESKKSCYALEASYHSMGGPSWSASSWFSGAPSCSWEGVSCRDENIVSLSLANSNLRGSIPADLSLLNSLSNLDLSSNSLSGPIPQELGLLSELSRLNLGNNELSGVLPLSVTELGSRANLCELRNNNQGLCLPVNPDYEQFGPVVCGLEASLNCEPEIFTSIESFEIRQERTRLVLSWQVADLNPELSFRVQQNQRNDFETIGTVVSVDDRLEYQFIITQPVSGVSVFRLQMISPSGTLKNGPELEVVFIPNRVLVRGPFPNPSSDISSLSFALEEDSFVEIDLVDLMGRTVKSLLAADLNAGTLESLSFSLRDLSPGLYFVQIQTETELIVKGLQVLR